MRKGRIGILLICVIICILIFVLGFQRENVKKSGSLGKTVEVLSAIEERVTEMDDVSYMQLKSDKNALYYNEIEQDEECGAVIEHVYYLNTENGEKKKEIISFKEEEGQLIDFIYAKSKGWYFLVGKPNGECCLVYLSENGNLENLAILNSFMKMPDTNIGSFKLQINANGDIIVYSKSGYCVLGTEGEKKKNEIFRIPQDYNLICLEGGNSIIEYWEMGVRQILIYSRGQTEKIDELNEIAQSISFEIIAEKDNQCLIKNDEKLYSFDTEDRILKELFTWSEQGISGEEITLVYRNNNGEIEGFLADALNRKVSKICWKDNVENNTHRQELLLGCIRGKEEVATAVARFNRENQEYTVIIQDYSRENLSIDEAETNMYKEILAGNGPDIIWINPENVDYRELEHNGVLEDLCPYLIKSTELNEEDFIKNLLESMKSREGLFLLPTNFAVDTIICREDKIGAKSGWSMEQLVQMREEKKDEKMFPYMNRENFLEFYICYGMDIENGEWDKNEFISALRMSETFPQIVEYDGDFGIYASGEVVADTAILYDMETYLFEKALWHTDIVCKGYPGVEGNGSVLIPINCWSISERSSYKEGAWKFIEKQFLDSLQEEGAMNRSFSSLKKVWDNQLESALGNDIINSYEMDGVQIDVTEASEEDLQTVRELVEGSSVIYSKDTELINIINEEVQSYFEKQKTAEEVADIVESRINIYINERK